MTRRTAGDGERRRARLPLALTLVLALATCAALPVACGGSTGGNSNAGSSAEPATANGSASASASVEPLASPSTASSSSPSAAASPSAAPRTTLRLYFLRDGRLGVAERRVAATTMPATAAVKQLLAGPTAAERSAGLSSAVPAGVKLRRLTISDGTARLDLSRAFAGGDRSGASMTARVAQIVYTLTRYPTVRAVDFKLDGRPVEALGDEGLLLERPQRRADWRRFEPAIFIEAPGVGGQITSPFVLSGTARVYEGSFTARLVDSSQRRIVNVPMQADAGGPARGRFSKEIAFSTAAAHGTLIVYSQSMEDGSRQDEVRIPVVFAAP
jgi:spore germination protein GerM